MPNVRTLAENMAFARLRPIVAAVWPRSMIYSRMCSKLAGAASLMTHACRWPRCSAQRSSQASGSRAPSRSPHRRPQSGQRSGRHYLPPRYKLGRRDRRMPGPATRARPPADQVIANIGGLHHVPNSQYVPSSARHLHCRDHSRRRGRVHADDASGCSDSRHLK
jgi:hypothetical protein